MSEWYIEEIASLNVQLVEMEDKWNKASDRNGALEERVAELEKELEEMTDLYREECDMAMDPSYEPKEDNNGN